MRPSKLRLPLKHRNRHHIVFFDCRADRFRQRTAVSNTRRAAVADQVEFQLVEVLRPARPSTSNR